MTLREWLAREGLSLRWLAGETGISYRTLLRYTSPKPSDRRYPSIELALRIERATRGAVRVADMAGPPPPKRAPRRAAKRRAAA